MSRLISPTASGEVTRFQTNDRSEVNRMIRLDGWFLERVEMDTEEGTTYTLTDRDPDNQD
mgnify:CR=1 FL=1